MNDNSGYMMFKGLQRPLEFLGIRGRFIYISAGAIGASFLGFLLISYLFGRIIGFVGMFVIMGLSLIVIYLKQKNGLHDKKRCIATLIVKHIVSNPVE